MIQTHRKPTDPDAPVNPRATTVGWKRLRLDLEENKLQQLLLTHPNLKTIYGKKWWTTAGVNCIITENGHKIEATPIKLQPSTPSVNNKSLDLRSCHLQDKTNKNPNPTTKTRHEQTLRPEQPHPPSSKHGLYHHLLPTKLILLQLQHHHQQQKRFTFLSLFTPTPFFDVIALLEHRLQLRRYRPYHHHQYHLQRGQQPLFLLPIVTFISIGFLYSWRGREGCTDGSIYLGLAG
ncbi:hypothetical protein NEUTE2DRAFT_151275 [Neurospora tetrasperma FGSC 2509]|nr:hypothetical protein NEUTE2DRAFT_151275 [Neurospora tetrasperma FGSC 2509]